MFRNLERLAAAAARRVGYSLLVAATMVGLSGCLSSGGEGVSASDDGFSDTSEVATSPSPDSDATVPIGSEVSDTSADVPEKPNTFPTFPLRVNAGGERYVDGKGNTWVADKGFNTGSTYSVKAAIDGTTDDPLYQTERVDAVTSPELAYVFDVPNGNYQVKLHFAEIWSGAWATGKRVFGVKVEGQLVESGIDIYAAVGANSSLVKTYSAKVSDGRLQIEFVRKTQNPTISAIEVIKLESTAIRVNAGGKEYVDGSGRTWNADIGFNTGSTYAVTTAIAGTNDDPLYQSERLDFNTAPELTYGFDVPNGTYQVKLHFAEIWSGAWAKGKRVFGIAIEDKTVESGLDIYAAVGANTALVKSYTASVTDGRLQIDFVHKTQNPTVSAIEVVSLETAPVAEPVIAQDGTPFTINVLANHTELTGVPVEVTIAGQPAHGTATIGANNTIVYVAAAGYSGTDSLIYGITDGSGVTELASITIQVACTSCTAERMLSLSWNPNPDTVTGYQVFRGPTAEQATQLVSDMPLNSGLIDPTAPRVQYRATTDLGLTAGQQACFRLKAYNNDSYSDYSQAVCGII
jgi:hypothetical protein